MISELKVFNCQMGRLKISKDYFLDLCPKLTWSLQLLEFDMDLDSSVDTLKA
jgi:hypothetical protein